MKLIKIKEDHYVVVDDSEIKYKDWYLDDTNQIRMCVVLDTDYWKSRKEYKKITHSTQPIESIVTENSFKSYEFIPLQEVKELIGEKSWKGYIDGTQWEVELVDGKLKLI